MVSIHAPNEGSDLTNEYRAQLHAVSIHAPNEGSDYKCPHLWPQSLTVSIHAPNEGSDDADSGL